MRLLFGLLGLVVVLAIVASVGKSQLKALSQMGATTTRILPPAVEGTTPGAPPGAPRDDGLTVAVPGGMPGAAPAQAEGTVPMQAQAIQNRVRDAANAALQQGMDRNARSQP